MFLQIQKDFLFYSKYINTASYIIWAGDRCILYRYFQIWKTNLCFFKLQYNIVLDFKNTVQKKNW